MNLIDQLGGYEQAKRVRDVPAASCFRVRGVEFTREELDRAMLLYRREHDFFEEGDQVVIISKRHSPKLWKWAHSTNWRSNHSLLDCGDGMLCPFSDYEFRHATDEEIANNARSK